MRGEEEPSSVFVIVTGDEKTRIGRKETQMEEEGTKAKHLERIKRMSAQFEGTKRSTRLPCLAIS
jgi:hypothetical protein